MSRIIKPYTWATDQVITAAELNAVFDKVYTEFNGNIDDSNIKENADIDGAKLLDLSIGNAKLLNNCINDANLDYSSVKVLRTGPNITNNGNRIARGVTPFTYVAGVVTVTITFDMDAMEGDPQFTSAPSLTLGVEIASDGNMHTATISDRKASGFNAIIKCSAGVATSGYLHWHALGNV